MESGRSRTKRKQWNVRTEGLTPSQQRCGPGLQGAVHDVCDVERRDFRAGTHLWASANEPWAWAICVSSAKRIGAQREGELSCDGKKFGRKATRMDEGGFGGEACRRVKWEVG